jgi:hypothetical protein
MCHAHDFFLNHAVSHAENMKLILPIKIKHTKHIYINDFIIKIYSQILS